MGPFPSRPTLGSIRGEGTPPPPPTNPSCHLRKERSLLPLEWLLTEGRGRSLTTVATTDAAAAASRIPTAAAATATTHCPDHEDVAVAAATSTPRRRSPSRLRRPQAVTVAAASGPPHHPSSSSISQSRSSSMHDLPLPVTPNSLSSRFPQFPLRRTIPLLVAQPLPLPVDFLPHPCRNSSS